MSTALTATELPAWMVVVPPGFALEAPVMLASTVLPSTFIAADPAFADWSEPAPPTATVTMVPRASASTVTEPLVRRVEFSIFAPTVLPRTFSATAMP